MREVCGRCFGSPVLTLPDEPIISTPPILIFGDFMQLGAARENRIYEEIKDITKLRNVLQVNKINVILDLIKFCGIFRALLIKIIYRPTTKTTLIVLHVM